MEQTSIFTKQSHISWREIEDLVVVLNPRHGCVHELNSTASFVWQKLDGENNISRITEQLAETYQLNQADAESDLLSFIEEAVRNEIVKEVKHEQ